MTTAQKLIARSISHAEIAHAEWSIALETALREACDDSVEASETVLEFWGTREDGEEWRVHLTGYRRITDSQILSLRREAAEHGDDDQVVLCDLALETYGADYELDPADFTTLTHNGARQLRGKTVEQARDMCRQALAAGFGGR